MIDMDEIMKRAQAASNRASQQLHENIEKGRKTAGQIQTEGEKAAAAAQHETQAAEQKAASQQRQVKILGQMFDPAAMEQMMEQAE